MTMDNLVKPEIKIELQGEEWTVKFELRNFAALRQVCGVTENDLLKGLINGDIGKIPYGIWASTLVFAPFDPSDPLKIEKQLDLEKLFSLTLEEIQEVNDKVIRAMEAYLPKQDAPAHVKKKKAQARMKAEEDTK